MLQQGDFTLDTESATYMVSITLEMSLGHNDYANFMDFPGASVIRVTENDYSSKGYETTIRIAESTLGIDQGTPLMALSTGDIAMDNGKVQFTNTRTGALPTGAYISNRKKTLAMMFIGMIVIVSAILAHILRRNTNAE